MGQNELHEQQSLSSLAVHIKRNDTIEESTITVVMHDILIFGRNISITHVSYPNDLTVSSQHCRLTYENRMMYLEDLHSTNGTYINGKKLTQKQPIASGVTIFLGAVPIQISWKELQ